MITGRPVGCYVWLIVGEFIPRIPQDRLNGYYNKCTNTIISCTTRYLFEVRALDAGIKCCWMWQSPYGEYADLIINHNSPLLIAV